MNEQQKDPMIEKITEELKAGNDALDGHVLSRLNQARQEALAQKPQPWWQKWFTPGYMLPAGTVAAGVFAALLFLQQGPPPANEDLVPVDDFEVIMAEESLELYEELEFYVWLETEQANAG